MNIDLMSISGHKIYGPKVKNSLSSSFPWQFHWCQGVGALYVRRRPRVRVEPIQNGGGQVPFISAWQNSCQPLQRREVCEVAQCRPPWWLASALPVSSRTGRWSTITSMSRGSLICLCRWRWLWWLWWWWLMMMIMMMVIIRMVVIYRWIPPPNLSISSLWWWFKQH